MSLATLKWFVLVLLVFAGCGSSEGGYESSTLENAGAADEYYSSVDYSE